MSEPVLLAIGRRSRRRAHSRRRPDADVVAGFSADRAAARNGTGVAVPHRGSVALRRARARLVLEQFFLQRAYRHAFRRADPLDFRPPPARQLRPIRFRPRVSSRRPACSTARAKPPPMPTFCSRVDFLRSWERRHGRIPPGSWILMRTDWSKRTDPVAYQNIDETGQHTPGPTPKR